MNATHILYQAAGSPPMTGDTSGICRTCGQVGTGLPFGAWVKDTFTDHDKLRPGDISCQPCQFCFSYGTPGLAERMGKDRPQRMINYSHFVLAGRWEPLSKGSKRRMTEILTHERPDLAVIAVSGQKHLIFRATPGWWQIEEQSLRPDVPGLVSLLAAVEQLYNGGFSKGEIESGRYIQSRILAFGLDRWHAIESGLRNRRGSALLALALFLAQKEEAEDGQVRDGEGVAVADLARHPGRVQEPLPAQHLAAVRGQREERGLHSHAQQVRQQSLFEIAGDDLP